MSDGRILGWIDYAAEHKTTGGTGYLFFYLFIQIIEFSLEQNIPHIFQMRF